MAHGRVQVSPPLLSPKPKAVAGPGRGRRSPVCRPPSPCPNTGWILRDTERTERVHGVIPEGDDHRRSMAKHGFVRTRGCARGPQGRLAGRLEQCVSRLRRVETRRTVENARVIPGDDDRRRFTAKHGVIQTRRPRVCALLGLCFATIISAGPIQWKAWFVALCTLQEGSNWVSKC